MAYIHFKLDVRRVLWPCENTEQLEPGILIHRTSDKIGGRLFFPRRNPQGEWICEVMNVYPGQRDLLEENLCYTHLTWDIKADLSTEPRVAEEIARYIRAITESDEAKVVKSWQRGVERAIVPPWDPHAGRNIRWRVKDGPPFQVSTVSRGSGTSSEWGYHFHRKGEELGTLIHLAKDGYSKKMKATEKPGCLLYDWDSKKPIVSLYPSQLDEALNIAVATTVDYEESNSSVHIDWYTKYKETLDNFVLDKVPIELQQSEDLQQDED